MNAKTSIRSTSDRRSLVRLTGRTPDTLRGLTFGLLFVLAIVVIWIGLKLLPVWGDAGAVLLALACGALLLPLAPARKVAARSNRIYYVRIGARVWRLYGDEETDRYFGQKQED